MISTACELAGLVVLAIAAWLLYPLVGLAVIGAELLLVGWATDGVAIRRRP